MPVAIDPGLPVRAVFLDAGGVQRQRMVLQPEAFFSSNRMLAAFDVGVLRLVRVAVGPLALGDLGKGAWRMLEPHEREALAPTTGR